MISDRSLVRIARVLGDSRSHPDLELMEKEYDVVTPNPSGNKQARALNLLATLRDWSPQPQGHRDLVEVIENLGITSEQSPLLASSLRADGFAIEDSRLLPLVPTQVDSSHTISKLERELEARGFRVALTHFTQAVANFVDGRNESSTSQVRSFVEDLIPSLSRLRGHVADEHNVGNALRSLRAEGFLDEEQFQMLKAFWGHVQDEGPHSGRTSPHEAEFRLKTAATVAAYLLAKHAAQPRR